MDSNSEEFNTRIVLFDKERYADFPATYDEVLEVFCEREELQKQYNRVIELLTILNCATVLIRRFDISRMTEVEVKYLITDAALANFNGDFYSELRSIGLIA